MKAEIREKDKLIESFMSVATAQSKRISCLQASTYAAPQLALSPSSRLSQALISDSADTIPWLPLTNAGTGADNGTSGVCPSNVDSDQSGCGPVVRVACGGAAAAAAA
ncbi:hypothetical protein ABVT39_008424 [Epinephelus coioides]